MVDLNVFDLQTDCQISIFFSRQPTPTKVKRYEHVIIILNIVSV